MGSEVKIKTELLSKIVPENFELNDAMVEEFIKVTGRSLKGQELYNKVLKNLKFRPELISIFDHIKVHFHQMSKSQDSNKFEAKWIFTDIEQRKSEMAVFEMQGEGDPVEMVQLLINNGHLKAVMD